MGRRPEPADGVDGAEAAAPDAAREELRRLPSAHAAVLRGLAAGASDRELAELVGVDPAALPAFLRVALAKLLGAVPPPATDGPDAGADENA